MSAKALKKATSLLTAAAITFACTYLPENNIRTSALKIGEGFQYEIENGEAVITSFENTREPVTVIPEEIDGVPVTTIRYLFGNITEITIPPSVKKIESKAFRGNYRLEKVIISENTTELGEYIFENCEKLSYCEIKSDIEELPKGTFSGCPMLSEVILPDSVKNLGERAFSGCSSLGKMDIPDSMTVLPDSLFKGCSSLSSIQIPENVTYIDNSVFNGCSSLLKITIPDGVTYIGEYAFAGCSSVQSFRLPETLEILSDGLFANCTSLTDVTLPETALSYYSNETTRVYGRDTFRNCEKLASITIPYGIEDIGANCFDGCSSLTELYLPDTIRYIDNYAFRNCSSLTELIIPGKSSICGCETFAGCSSLKELYIPESTYSFAAYGEYTFKDCTSLETLYLPLRTHLNYYNVFSGCTNLKNLYVGSLTSSFGGNHLGYIYDKETDTYIKNEDLTIYCREGSTALEYAQENGFKYETVDGFEPYLVYMGTGNSEEDYEEIIIDDYEADKAFVISDDEYLLAQRIFYTDLKNEAIFIVYTGLTEEILSEANADVVFEPTFLSFSGTDLTEVYDDITYQMVTDEGLCYLVITCTADAGNDVSALGIRENLISICFNSYIVPRTEYITGDIDNNGSVTAADLVVMKKYLLGMITSDEINYPAADLNEDGKVNILDLLIFKNVLLNS